MNNTVTNEDSINRGLIIRKVEAADKDAVRRIVRELHEKTVFGNMPFSDEKFDKHAEKILSRPLHMNAVVAEHKDRVIGFAWATVGQHAISEEGLIGTCHVIAVETGRSVTKQGGIAMGHLTRRATAFLMLLKAIKLWANQRGAKHVMVHVTTGADENGLKAANTEKLLRKVSANEIGGAFLV